ncbi:MAG: hypothetical protein F4X34_09435 [Chloroflexi bacterium]|nr:hypothetical protein [Chloroflexota bacterium]
MADEPRDRHDRITHIDLLNLFNSKIDELRIELRSEIRESRNEMRWMIGVGFALPLLFMAFVTFVR